MDNSKIVDALSSTKVIAILRGIPKSRMADVLDAVYAGGVRLAEITFDATGEVSDDETAGIIKDAVLYTKGRMYIGAGTVIRNNQVGLVKASGGEFIISPNTDCKIIKETKILGMLSMPAAMTVTEICTALDAGADYIKVFPAGVLGVEFIKAVKGPLKHAKMLAVGGISAENTYDYLDAGCVGFGIGSSIVNTKLCLNCEFDTIQQNAQRYINACIKWRKKHEQQTPLDNH